MWRSYANHALVARIDRFKATLDRAQPFNIGFPGSTDFNHTALADLATRYLINNVGDPLVAGVAANHTKVFEREVVNFVGDLFHAPADDRWGYVTAGGTESNLYALYMARRRHRDAIVYYSEAAHPSIGKAADLLSMPSAVVRADDRGTLDYQHFGSLLRAHRARPAIVVATVGTTQAEAIDDVRRLVAVLDEHEIRRRFIHADAALSGIPLAFVDPSLRPGFDLLDGADSIAVSGHKFLAVPMPCSVVLIRDSMRTAEPADAGQYTGSPDSTLSGSRNGHAVLMLWSSIKQLGRDGLRARAERSRELARYTYNQLTQIGWPAFRHELAFTVVLAAPQPPGNGPWVLPEPTGGWSHIVCMPGVTKPQIDAYISFLRKQTASPTTPPAATRLFAATAAKAGS